MPVERFCQIVERDTAGISVLWKGFHMLCLLAAIPASLFTVLEMEFVAGTFGRRCVLFAKLNFTDHAAYETIGRLHTNVTFHNALTIWGSASYCSYAKCTYLFSIILAMIMFAFFVIVPKGGYSSDKNYIYTDAWKIVVPALVTSLTITVCLSIAFWFTYSGTRFFTEQIYQHVKQENLHASDDECRDKFDEFSLIFNRKQVGVARHIKRLQICGAVTLVSWILLILSLILRMFIGVDFRIMVYSIKPGRIFEDVASISSNSYYSDDDIDPMFRRFDTTSDLKIKSSTSVVFDDDYSVIIPSSSDDLLNDTDEFENIPRRRGTSS